MNFDYTIFSRRFLAQVSNGTDGLKCLTGTGSLQKMTRVHVWIRYRLVRPGYYLGWEILCAELHAFKVMSV